MVRASHIVDNDLRRATAIPCIDAEAACNVERLVAVREEVAEAKADGALSADRCHEVLPFPPDAARGKQADVLEEEPRLGVSLAEGLEFLQAFAEVERDGRGREDSIYRERGDKILRRNAPRHILPERGHEFLEVFPRERASRRLRMTAETPEKMRRTSKECGDVDCGNAPQRRRAHVAGDVRDHARPPALLRELPREEPDDAGREFFIRNADERRKTFAFGKRCAEALEQFPDQRLAGGIELVEDTNGFPSVEEGAQGKRRIVHAARRIEPRGHAEADVTTGNCRVG